MIESLLTFNPRTSEKHKCHGTRIQNIHINTKAFDSHKRKTPQTWTTFFPSGKSYDLTGRLGIVRTMEMSLKNRNSCVLALEDKHLRSAHMQANSQRDP